MMMTKPKRVAAGSRGISSRQKGIGLQAVKNVPAAPFTVPEELESVWDDEIAKDFKALKKEQQDFLIVYFRTGNPAESYRKGYNKPLASDHLASNSAYQVLEGIGVGAIIAKLQNQKTADLFLVINGYRKMAQATKPEWTEDKNGQWQNVGDVPDWQARDKAFTGIRKVRGLDQPTEVKGSLDITSKVIQVELPKKLNG